MAAGNMLLQANDLKVAVITFEDGATGNMPVVVPKEGGVLATEEYAGNHKDTSYKSTPVTITSWSYVGTTITLNVAAHTFIAGDCIEIQGLTATTYAANGVQLVTDVTTTTIVFTLGATPTGTAGVSSATVKGYSTVNGRVSESAGTWQNVTTSRVTGTTYTNTTGKAIELAVYGYSSTAAIQVNIVINSVSIPLMATNSPTTFGGLAIKVPTGATYKIESASGSFTAAAWFELR